MSQQFGSRRRGVIAVKVAILMVPVMAFTALALDSGYLLKVRTELQSAADAAALAAARELVPDADGDQDLEQVRTALRAYVQENMANSGFTVADEDIEIGRYERETIYSELTLIDEAPYDTVRVTIRRDSTANSAVQLYFAPLIGIPTCNVSVTATAILPQADRFYPGDGILPFAVSQSVWNNHDVGDQFQAYNGRIVDAFGNNVPGNWGTVDIGSQNNSTADLSAQILNGLRQTDLNALYQDGRISTNKYIDASVDINVQADTGLSSGLKHAVQAIHGQSRYMPIYGTASGNGNNAQFEIVGWGFVKVVSSNWNGNNNTKITFQKTSGYDGKLRPKSSLSDDSDVIENAYAHPILVE